MDNIKIKLSSFLNYFDLNEASIIDIYNRDHNFYIKADLTVYQEFMANGFRSDFDIDVTYLFEFVNVKIDVKPSKKYLLTKAIYKDNYLSLTINSNIYTITDCDVNATRLNIEEDYL